MTIRVGVIGTGNIGQDHIRRLTEVTSGAEVVAVTDIDTARAAETADRVGARALADGAAVIGDAAVDAVLVTSSGPTHEEYVLGGIAAGKPVFCEKPLATTAEACLRIVDAEVAYGRRLVQVGFMRRYDPGYRAMKRVVADGRIGAPLMVHCAHRNATTAVPYYASSMAVTDTAVHEIDVLRWLLGEEFVATTVLKPRRSSTAPEGLADPQIMLFETVSGVHADVEVYVNCRYGYDIRCELVGETGTVSLPDGGPVSVRSAESIASPITSDWRVRFRSAYDTEIQEWVDGVAAGVISGPSAWDGYAAAVTTDACLEAQSSGRRVAVTLKDRPVFYASVDTRIE